MNDDDYHLRPRGGGWLGRTFGGAGTRPGERPFLGCCLFYVLVAVAFLVLATLVVGWPWNWNPR